MQTESIQSMGGKARVKSMTPEQLSESARKAAEARWAAVKPPRAIHKGNFKEEFGIDVDCYVLDDREKTAVISQRGLGRAIGLSDNGTALPRFLATKAVSRIVGGAELAQKLAQPLKFQWGSGGVEQPPGIFHGFDVTLLIDLCRALVDAEARGDLGKRNAKVAAQAHVILNASAKSGIKGLVYALAGYSPTAEEVITAFKLYVQEEARKYSKEFPPELYQAWYRLYQISPVQGRGRPWQFKHLTVNHIYYPLAKSNGMILKLLRALKANGGEQKTKLFQFLNEIGARALSRQLGRVLEMAESSADKAEYEKKTFERFGGEHQMEFALLNQSPN